MSFILNIETATKNCSVSLAKDGKTILLKEIAEEGYSHAEKLHVFIQELIKKSGIAFSDLSAIAVSKGPGSYTGLRIGVSAAKGLCYALDIPLIALDTLKSLASKATIDNGWIVPMLDARRMEVYSAIYDKNHFEIRAVKPEIITVDSFQDTEEIIYFLGDCLEKCKTVLTKSNFVFLDEFVFPSAMEMSTLSFDKYKKSNFENIAYFEPFYGKEFMFK